MCYSPNIAVAFDQVTKEYDLYANDRSRMMSAVCKRIAHETVLANDDLSFTIYKGETVALLGRNGSGKSTALKLITGVAYPTQGKVTVQGRVSPLLDLSAGFDQRLTGRENIQQRGLIWGMTGEEIKDLVPEVVEFADIGVYIDQPVKTYSAGMKARLGFAFASCCNSDIIIVDETLAVGDARFNQKCLEKIRSLMAQNEDFTVLFVTHSTLLATQFCDRGIVLHEGKLVFDGFIYDAIREHKRILAFDENDRSEAK